MPKMQFVHFNLLILLIHRYERILLCVKGMSAVIVVSNTIASAGLPMIAVLELIKIAHLISTVEKLVAFHYSSEKEVLCRLNVQFYIDSWKQKYR